MIIPQLPGLSEPVDPATRAFELLRGEVALLRLAMEGLAAERASIVIPDYSQTLAKITTSVATVDQRLVTISEKPAFGLSPQGLSREILTASEKVRREDREAITLSGDILRQTTQDLTRSLMSAREAARQQTLLLWTGGGGIVAGMLFWALLVGPALRRLF